MASRYDFLVETYRYVSIDELLEAADRRQASAAVWSRRQEATERPT